MMFDFKILSFLIFLFGMVVIATAFLDPFTHLANAAMALVIAAYIWRTTDDIIILRREEK